MDRFQVMTAFVRVVETGSFSAAARDLRMGQPAVSKAIAGLEEHLRIVQPGGFMFFHDTHQPSVFPGLATIEPRLRERGIFCTQFQENSRSDEHCDRGFLFAVNQKGR